MTNEHLKSYYSNAKFHNPDITIKPKSLFNVFKWMITAKSTPWPAQLAVSKYCPPAQVGEGEIMISSVGHATFLIQAQGRNILTDPVWSQRVSPLSFIGPKRITPPGIDFTDLPSIDIVLISHNHYDHLDLATLKKLWQHSKPVFVTPLGNDKIIKKALPEANIISLNWYEHTILNDLRLDVIPSQHWSSRIVIDTNKSLWGGFVIHTKVGQICFIGDSGYDQKMFQTIAQHFNNIVFAILPIGSYEPRWFMRQVHMNPADALLAYQDLKAKFFIPSHFGVFKLTDEGYETQLIDYQEAIKQSKVEPKNIATLYPGQSVLFKDGKLNFQAK